MIQKNLTTRAALLVALVLLMTLPSPASAAEGVVNVNQAGAEELSLLPRVGPAVAARIVEFREQNGPFETKADLMLVRGIGEKTYELLEPWVTLEGPTTLDEKVRSPRRTDDASAGDGGADERGR